MPSSKKKTGYQQLLERLSPEALERLRTRNRRNAKNSRERTKQKIINIEKKIAAMRRELEKSKILITHIKEENVFLRTMINLKKILLD